MRDKRGGIEVARDRAAFNPPAFVTIWTPAGLRSNQLFCKGCPTLPCLIPDFFLNIGKVLIISSEIEKKKKRDESERRR